MSGDRDYYKQYRPCRYCGHSRMVASLAEPNDAPCLSCRSSLHLWLNPVGAWVDDAACSETDPEAFFPTNGDTRNEAAAKKVCNRCDVRLECLQYALGVDEPHGIWGGLTALERKRLKKKKGGTAA